METKLTALKLPLELHSKIKEIALREGKDMQEIFQEQLEKYVKEHGDGNPVYSLDQFQEPDFRICPAVFRNFQAWKDYYSKLTEKEYKELDRQINMILTVHNKEFYRYR